MDRGASSYHRFLKGDREGLVRIVEDYYDDLVRYLTRYLGNEDDAEDMAEEALLVLMNKRPAFRGDATFKTWLFSIAKNVTLKYLYKNNRTIPTAQAACRDRAVLSEVFLCAVLFREVFLTFLPGSCSAPA